MDIDYLHRAAHDALKRAKRVLIVSHPKPDGDTLGAASAMLQYCRKAGIPADAFCLDPVPEQYLYMPGTEEYGSDKGIFASPAHDVLAVFDAGDLRYAGIDGLIPTMPAKPLIINFDHHATNEKFGDMNVLDVKASSTAEVVYDFFQTNGIAIGKDVATCLLTGILTDTGGFSNPATTGSSLTAASDLLRRGAKIQDVANRLVRNKTIDALRLWGKALSRLKYNQKLGSASTAVFTTDLVDIDDEHVEGISNFLNRFLDVKIVLVLKELPDGKVKGSIRSADDLDVSLPAKLLGGGGHKKAAGFTIAGRIVETANGWKVE